MSIRKVLFWMHLVAGCVGGIIILTMSITGVLLTYERQILARVERGSLRVEPPSPGAARLPVEALLLKAGEQSAVPAGASLTLRSDPREPAEIGALREGAVYLNPYTGQVLGKADSQGWRAFFQDVTTWHRYLGAKGEGRTVAKAITGACNLAFLGLVLSGMYLWIPKKWSMKSVGAITWFRGGLGGKARDFNWHNVFGIWMAVPLAIVVVTAVPMSYVWGNDLVYKLTGSEPPRGPERGGGQKKGPPRGGPQQRREGRGGDAAPMPSMEFAGLNQLWVRAEGQVSGWRSIAMRLPEGSNRPVVFTIDTGDGGQPQKRATLGLDRKTAAVVQWDNFASLNAGRRLRSWTRFLHTGEALGIVGQTVAGLASFAGVMLVWTGISLALRRLAAWSSRRKRAAELELTAAR